MKNGRPVNIAASVRIGWTTIHHTGLLIEIGV